MAVSAGIAVMLCACIAVTLASFFYSITLYRARYCAVTICTGHAYCFFDNTYSKEQAMNVNNMPSYTVWELHRLPAHLRLQYNGGVWPRLPNGMTQIYHDTNGARIFGLARLFVLPAWYGIALLSMCLLVLRPWQLVPGRRRAGLCSTCGYDLRGTLSSCCSECGAPCNTSDSTRR